MVYRKGERTNRHREADYPFAIDVPVPADGLGSRGLNAIARAMAACTHPTEHWSHSEFRAFGERMSHAVRIGAKSSDDAERILSALADWGAQRAR